MNIKARQFPISWLRWLCKVYSLCLKVYNFDSPFCPFHPQNLSIQRPPFWKKGENFLLKYNQNRIPAKEANVLSSICTILVGSHLCQVTCCIKICNSFISSALIGEISLPFISLPRLGRYKYCLYTIKTTGYFLCNEISDRVDCVFCLLFS